MLNSDKLFIDNIVKNQNRTVSHSDYLRRIKGQHLTVPTSTRTGCIPTPPFTATYSFTRTWRLNHGGQANNTFHEFIYDGVDINAALAAADPSQPLVYATISGKNYLVKITVYSAPGDSYYNKSRFQIFAANVPSDVLPTGISAHGVTENTFSGSPLNIKLTAAS